MKLTLLLDLDDTLLESNMNTFIPAYLKALGSYLSSYANPDHLIKMLLIATKKMIANTNPGHTLEEVFDANFYPRLGLDKEIIYGAIENFYAEDFQRLQSLTRPRPEAIQLVEEAFRRGYSVGIATNPIFPRAATEQRIAWAKLSKYPFTLISSYENFHFAKPHPAYIAEFLAQMGWPDEPILMVGDDLENDYRAAHGAGIPMYWVKSTSKSAQNEKPVAEGGISDLLTWLDSINLKLLKPNFSSSSAWLAGLRATPAAISSLTDALSLTSWTQRSTPNTWSLTEIVCHLRDAELEVNIPRLKKILHEDSPFLPGLDTDAWVKERDYASQDGQAALQDFTAARVKTLDLLEDLPDVTWQRLAQHAILGPTTLHELISIIGRHEHLHLQQIRQILGPLP